MKKPSPAVHKIAIVLAMLFVATCANASDLTVWQPTTAAGGAPVPPGYWDQEASYRFFGTGSTQPSNVTLQTYTSTTNDNSKITTNSTTGAQTNIIPIGGSDSSTQTVTNTITH